MAKFSDYRVATGHLSHPKFLQIFSHPLGPLAYAAWHGLLDHCASWSPFGELGELDPRSFARVSKITAMVPGSDFEGVMGLLIEAGLIGHTEDGHVLHDWEDHQAGIVAHAKKVAAGQKGGKTTQKRRRDTSQKCIPGEAPGGAPGQAQAKHPAKHRPSTSQAGVNPLRPSVPPSPPPSHQEGEGGEGRSEAGGGDRPQEGGSPPARDGEKKPTPPEPEPERVPPHPDRARKFRELREAMQAKK